MKDSQPEDLNEPAPLDPEDFLRALMKISPEDAAKAREQSPATRPKQPQEAEPADQDTGGT